MSCSVTLYPLIAGFVWPCNPKGKVQALFFPNSGWQSSLGKSCYETGFQDSLSISVSHCQRVMILTYFRDSSAKIWNVRLMLQRERFVFLIPACISVSFIHIEWFFQYILFVFFLSVDKLLKPPLTPELSHDSFVFQNPRKPCLVK